MHPARARTTSTSDPVRRQAAFAPSFWLACASPLHSGRVRAERHKKVKSRNHHRVYVVLLENPCGDGRAGYYVGMSGLPPQERFANHKLGYKSARVVKEHGVALAWEWFADIPSMSYKEAALAEPTLADDLRDLGFLVYGPTNRKPCRLRRRRKK